MLEGTIIGPMTVWLELDLDPLGGWLGLDFPFNRKAVRNTGFLEIAPISGFTPSTKAFAVQKTGILKIDPLSGSTLWGNSKAVRNPVFLEIDPILGMIESVNELRLSSSPMFPLTLLPLFNNRAASKEID